MARDFSRRADPPTRRRHTDRGIHPRNFLCLADYRPISSVISTQMASRLGPGFDRIGSAFLQARAKGFWIFHVVRPVVAKNVERSHCSIFSILTNQLGVMGAVGSWVCWFVRLVTL